MNQSLEHMEEACDTQTASYTAQRQKEGTEVRGTPPRRVTYPGCAAACCYNTSLVAQAPRSISSTKKKKKDKNPKICLGDEDRSCTMCQSLEATGAHVSRRHDRRATHSTDMQF